MSTTAHASSFNNAFVDSVHELMRDSSRLAQPDKRTVVDALTASCNLLDHTVSSGLVSPLSGYLAGQLFDPNDEDGSQFQMENWIGEETQGVDGDTYREGEQSFRDLADLREQLKEVDKKTGGVLSKAWADTVTNMIEAMNGGPTEVNTGRDLDPDFRVVAASVELQHVTPFNPRQADIVYSLLSNAETDNLPDDEPPTEPSPTLSRQATQDFQSLYSRRGIAFDPVVLCKSMLDDGAYGFYVQEGNYEKGEAGGVTNDGKAIAFMSFNKTEEADGKVWSFTHYASTVGDGEVKRGNRID
ncbi:hypothetical protein B9479_007762 [Cryptococcus floricola]|uniref:Uncharacterized protein n=1 Tax=Cryptococcus floricola TaxID=2591691 RepID=A0A5D3AJC3_9TREE|nr:hypothetical protein B9479_007762 [Cryptococcus floricola]